MSPAQPSLWFQHRSVTNSRSGSAAWMARAFAAFCALTSRSLAWYSGVP
jgi:hypothetical protein